MPRLLIVLLLQFEGDVENVFCRCMQVEYECLGEMTTCDLVPDGGNVPVTAANREQYVKLFVQVLIISGCVQLLCLTLPPQWLLVDSIAKQFNAFSKGFFSVCGGPALELFKPQELELLICGSPTLDFHALEEAALLEDGSEPALNLLRVNLLLFV